MTHKAEPGKAAPARFVGRLRASVALALAVAAAATAAPQSEAPPPAPTAKAKAATGWWLQSRAVSELKLTPAQQTAIADAERSHREARAAAMQAYSQAFAAFLVVLAAEPVDRDALETRRAAFVAAWDQLGKVNADRLVALRGILSAQQLERLPQVAPGALRAGPLALRMFGEAGLQPPAAQP